MQLSANRVSYLSRRIVRSLRRQATLVGGIRLQRQLVTGRGLAARVTSVQSEALHRLGARFEVLGCSRPPSHLSALRSPDDSAPEAKAIRPDLDYPEDATGPFGLITLPHARVCMPSAMHLVDGWLLEESMLTRGIIANPKYWWQARTARWKATQRLPSGVLGPLTWHHNFYHWLIEILPRLRMLGDGQVDSSLPIYMPESSPSFVRESLNLVGLAHRVRWLPDGVYDAEGLIVPSRLSSSAYPTSVAIDWLRERILGEPIAGETLSTPRYLYISRRDVADRVPRNEQQIASAMSSLGFEVVNFSKMDLTAQIRLTSRARLLVGAHGAGFAHVAFLPEGAGVIEMAEEGGMLGGGYQYLASLVNARYGVLVYRRGLVDVPRLVHFVRQMLEAVECGRPGSVPQGDPTRRPLA